MHYLCFNLLKNANTVTYTISMNWSLEIARALTGGIGIVLTIPITILFMEIFETLRRRNNECCIYIGVIAPLSDDNFRR